MNPADQKMFVPEGVEFESTNSFSADELLKIETFTLRTYGKNAMVLASLRNVGRQLACDNHVAMVLQGSNGETFASADVYMYAAALYEDFTTAGCLAPGEVGVGGAILLPEGGAEPDSIVSQVSHVVYQFQGYLPTDAVKLDLVGLADVTISSAASRVAKVQGRFHNGGTTPISELSAFAFSLNAAGRPLAMGRTQNSSATMPTSDWNFDISLEGPVDKYVVVASYPTQ
ncbi:MAG TPA: hypothetical protein VFQ35_26450 [Polyangiaceae bacterium]|nr:hypothetical protein [Polyangiaceae bacterium]